jgi:hypothetical protein
MFNSAAAPQDGSPAPNEGAAQLLPGGPEPPPNALQTLEAADPSLVRKLPMEGDLVQWCMTWFCMCVHVVMLRALE